MNTSRVLYDLQPSGVGLMNAKEALDYEAGNMIASLHSDDHREAVKAFIEKRKPHFQGY